MGMMLRVENLSFSYGGKEPVWRGVTFDARPGEVLSVLGPNGTGKSTLLRCMAGLEASDEGRVLAGEHDMTRIGRRQAARTVAFVPQMHTPVFAFSGLDVVVMGRTAHIGAFAAPSKHDLDVARKALETVGMLHLASVPYNETSGGERQLILFARALAQEAEVLLLDEPTSHLDFGNQSRILALIRSLADQGLTVVMTTHFPDHALEISEQTCLLSKGRLLGSGRTETILTPETLSELYGLTVNVHRLEGGRVVCTTQGEGI